ncbi:MAG: HlyD family type I secretion periplasmic adaptor subunit [Burkholderiaceae bacterium]|nr:HlyD family type I secretion periplasmic adaptor subunit [Burkholderiaceae bacterium]
MSWLMKPGSALVRMMEAIRLHADKHLDPLFARLDHGEGDADQDFMGDADRVIIEQEPIRARILLRALLAAILLFIIWAGLVNVDEVTKGDGKVIPSQQLQVLQSLDGGIVSQILVKEGETVAPGQVLLQIDSTRFESSLKENRSEYLSLSAKAARLFAIREGKPFEPPADVASEDPKTVEQERQLYESANSEMQAQISIARQQQSQRQQELSEARAKEAQAAQAYDSTVKELNVTKPLLSSGAVSEVEVLRLQREVDRFRGERDIAAAQIQRAQAAIGEATRKIQEVELDFRNNAGKEFSETEAKLNALTQTSTGLSDRVKQSAIRSPVKGTVKRLLVNTVGGVVQPGKDIVEIVPLEGKLILEAKVQPRDIAFLRPGQPAMVKFTAYDFSIYGGLDATVDLIGADTVTDERGNTFYTVRVTTNKTSLANNLPIIPGMVAEVDIVTGQKTILSYLLKPVLRAKQAAFTER